MVHLPYHQGGYTIQHHRTSNCDPFIAGISIYFRNNNAYSFTIITIAYGKVYFKQFLLYVSIQVGDKNVLMPVFKLKMPKINLNICISIEIWISSYERKSCIVCDNNQILWDYTPHLYKIEVHLMPHTVMCCLPLHEV